jgi:hypothetical protein
LTCSSASTPARAPSDWASPDFDFSQFTLPATLPVRLPAELARQRPDILAAEARLHAATAQVGVATANLYPHITLTGSAGQQALTLGTLFTGVGELFIDIPCNLRERTERLPLGCIGVGHGARLSVYERLSVREIPFRVFRSISKCRGESQAFIERRSRRPPLSS